MRVDRPLLLLLAALTAGCADPEPFVDVNPLYTAGTVPAIAKPVDPVLRDGRFRVCYSDATPWTEVMTLATESCGKYGLRIHSTYVQKWQCRATSPHVATFTCFDPDMVKADGTPVNPFDPQAVAAWEQATGKTAKPHNFMTGPGAAAAAPPAPPVGAERPGPPPAPAPVAPTVPAPAAGAAAPGSGFSLPPGSWGDHFHE